MSKDGRLSGERLEEIREHATECGCSCARKTIELFAHIDSISKDASQGDSISFGTAPETWQPIETYRRDSDGWGDTVLVLLPPVQGEVTFAPGQIHRAPVPPRMFVAWLEADMWLTHDPDDAICCDELYAEPTHWMPFPLPAPPGDTEQPNQSSDSSSKSKAGKE